MHLDGKGFRYPNWPAVNKENSGRKAVERRRGGGGGGERKNNETRQYRWNWWVVGPLFRRCPTRNDKRIEKKRDWQPDWTECNYEISSSCTTMHGFEKWNFWRNGQLNGGTERKLCTLFWSWRLYSFYLVKYISSNYRGKMVFNRIM